MGYLRIFVQVELLRRHFFAVEMLDDARFPRPGTMEHFVKHTGLFGLFCRDGLFCYGQFRVFFLFVIAYEHNQ